MLPIAPSHPAPPGALSPCGKYLLCGPLGRGGQADVVLAIALGMVGFRKLVVLKQLRPELAAQPELVTMFLDEARLAARLNHPSIVDTYEVGGCRGSYFIAMEHLDGQPLSRLRRHPGAAALTPRVWARLMTEALGALHYAHELTDYDGSPLGIVHRDISPHNLFVTYDGRAKLVDFGIAKATLNNVTTATGMLKGKIAYMAPEQVRGSVDRRADIFAAGVVLWELIAGRKLFTGETVHVLTQLLYEPVPRLSTVLPTVDPALDEIVARAVEKDPARRFQTAEEMREALAAYLAGYCHASCAAELSRWMHLSFENERAALQRQVHEAVERHTFAPGEGWPPVEPSPQPEGPNLPLWQPPGPEVTLSMSVAPSPSTPRPSATTLFAPPASTPPAFALPTLAPPTLAPPTLAPPTLAPPTLAPPAFAPRASAPPAFAHAALVPPAFAHAALVPPVFAHSALAPSASASLRRLVSRWHPLFSLGTLGASVLIVASALGRGATTAPAVDRPSPEAALAACTCAPLAPAIIEVASAPSGAPTERAAPARARGASPASRKLSQAAPIASHVMAPTAVDPKPNVPNTETPARRRRIELVDDEPGLDKY